MSALKAVQPFTQRRARVAEGEQQTGDTYGPWLSAQSAAKFLDFSDCREPVEAFRAWAKRHGVCAAHRGSKLIYAKADLLRAIGASARKVS